MDEWLSRRTKSVWVFIGMVAETALVYADDNVITGGEWTLIGAAALTFIGTYFLPNKMEGINVQTRAQKQLDNTNAKVQNAIRNIDKRAGGNDVA